MIHLTYLKNQASHPSWSQGDHRHFGDVIYHFYSQPQTAQLLPTPCGLHHLAQIWLFTLQMNFSLTAWFSEKLNTQFFRMSEACWSVWNLLLLAYLWHNFLKLFDLSRPWDCESSCKNVTLVLLGPFSLSRYIQAGTSTETLLAKWMGNVLSSECPHPGKSRSEFFYYGWRFISSARLGSELQLDFWPSEAFQHQRLGLQNCQKVGSI